LGLSEGTVQMRSDLACRINRDKEKRVKRGQVGKKKQAVVNRLF